MGDVLLFHSADCRDGREDGVTVIRATATKQFAVAKHRGPRTQAVVPSHHGRLLIEMAIHQDRGGVVAIDLDEDQRGTALDFMSLDS